MREDNEEKQREQTFPNQVKVAVSQLQVQGKVKQRCKRWKENIDQLQWEEVALRSNISDQMF